MSVPDGMEVESQGETEAAAETVTTTAIVPFVGPAWEPASRQAIRWSRVLIGYETRVSKLRVATLWFSTLGGAYSALGDARQSHSLKALQLAQIQLRLATALGDDGLAARCRLFVAWSKIQAGDLVAAATIVAREERRALPTGSRPDPQLLQMCAAAQQKINLKRLAMQAPLAIEPA
eukprot:m.420522 g.420522  ORF g.420522 m.420522 type:complete len:177 (-) comp32576_c0_seq1:1197-1727(-)